VIIVKEQKFDYLPPFSKAMALTQEAVARVVRNQITTEYKDLKTEFEVLIGCLVGVLRESIHQTEVVKGTKEVRNISDFKIMKNDLNKLLDVLNTAHDQIEDIRRKSNIGR
jgi:hypothetical protein